MSRATFATLAFVGLAGCAEGAAEETALPPFEPIYGGAGIVVLDDDLVSVVASMKGARDGEDMADYTGCVVARYALDEGYGFARHVRTNLDEEGGIWRADAVYTVSSALPDGLRTIDAEVRVADCAERDIPTV